MRGCWSAVLVGEMGYTSRRCSINKAHEILCYDLLPLVSSSDVDCQAMQNRVKSSATRDSVRGVEVCPKVTTNSRGIGGTDRIALVMHTDHRLQQFFVFYRGRLCFLFQVVTGFFFELNQDRPLKGVMTAIMKTHQMQGEATAKMVGGSLSLSPRDWLSYKFPSSFMEM